MIWVKLVLLRGGGGHPYLWSNTNQFVRSRGEESSQDVVMVTAKGPGPPIFCRLGYDVRVSDETDLSIGPLIPARRL